MKIKNIFENENCWSKQKWKNFGFNRYRWREIDFRGVRTGGPAAMFLDGPPPRRGALCSYRSLFVSAVLTLCAPLADRTFFDRPCRLLLAGEEYFHPFQSCNFDRNPSTNGKFINLLLYLRRDFPFENRRPVRRRRQYSVETSPPKSSCAPRTTVHCFPYGLVRSPYVRLIISKLMFYLQ